MADGLEIPITVPGAEKLDALNSRIDNLEQSAGRLSGKTDVLSADLEKIIAGAGKAAEAFNMAGVSLSSMAANYDKVSAGLAAYDAQVRNTAELTEILVLTNDKLRASYLETASVANLTDRRNSATKTTISLMGELKALDDVTILSIAKQNEGLRSQLALRTSMPVEQAKYAAMGMVGEGAAQGLIGSNPAGLEFSRQLSAEMAKQAQQSALIATEQAKYASATMTGEAAAQKLLGIQEAGLGFSKGLSAEMAKQAQLSALMASEQAKYAAMGMVGEGAAQRLVGQKVGGNLLPTAETSAFTAEAEKAATGMGVMRSGLRGVAAATGNLVLTYGQLLPLVAGFAAASAVKETIKLGQGFEYAAAYANFLAKQAGDATVPVDKLKEKLLGITNVRQSISELEKGVSAGVGAGLSPEESLKGVAEAARFATLANVDLSKSYVENVRIQGAFGISTDEVANKLLIASASSASTIANTQAALLKMTELGSVAGFSIDEELTMIGLMAKMGKVGEEAGTAARTSLLKMIDPVSKFKDDLKLLGIQWSAFNSDNSAKPLLQDLNELYAITSKLNKKDQVTVLTDLFTLRATKGGGNAVAAMQNYSAWAKDLQTRISQADQGVSVLQQGMVELSSTGQAASEMMVKAFKDTMTAAYETNPAVLSFYSTLEDIGKSREFRDFLSESVTGLFELGIALATVVESVGFVYGGIKDLTGLSVGQYGIIGAVLWGVGGEAAVIVASLEFIYNQLVKFNEKTRDTQTGKGAVDRALGDITVNDFGLDLDAPVAKDLTELEKLHNSIQGVEDQLKDLEEFKDVFSPAQLGTSKFEEKIAILQKELFGLNMTEFSTLSKNLLDLSNIKVHIDVEYGVSGLSPMSLPKGGAGYGVGEFTIDKQLPTVSSTVKSLDDAEADRKAAAAASKMNHAHQQELAMLKSQEEAKFEIIKAANAKTLELDTEAYQWGKIGLQQYLTDRHKALEQEAAENVLTKQKELDNAREMAGKLAAVVNRKGEANPAGDLSASSEANKKVFDAEKALTAAQSALTLTKLRDANETLTLTKQQLDGYENIHIALLQQTGDTIGAQKATDDLYKTSTAYVQMKAEADAGNLAAAKAIEDKEKSLLVIKQQVALTDQDARLQDQSSLDQLNGSWDEYYLLQVKILDNAIKQADLAGKPTNFLKQQKVDAEALTGTLSAFEKGLQKEGAQWTSTAKNMVDVAKATADAMQQGFSDVFFDGMQGKFKSLGDYITAFMSSVERAVADSISKNLVGNLLGGSNSSSGLGGILSGLFGGSSGGSTYTGGGVTGAVVDTSGSFGWSVPWAKGGAFPSGNISAYSNSIVDRPTFFATGGNVMGEAGPEAVIPLTRSSDGSLGVKSSGSGGFQQNVQIINKTDSKVSTQTSQDGSSMTVLIEQLENKIMARANRGTGIGPWLKTQGRY